jgi:hypothetical protein
LVDKRRLAVVDVGDDGDVAERHERRLLGEKPASAKAHGDAGLLPDADDNQVTVAMQHPACRRGRFIAH